MMARTTSASMKGERTTYARGRFVLAGSVALALSACARVAPYERGRLAHPTMAAGPLQTAAEGHVHAVQEGAVGGSLAAESGCGCN